MENMPADPGDWTDERHVVEALRRRDPGAFEALVERHEVLMQRVASMYVVSPAVAQDVVQDTWLSVLKGIDSFEARSSIEDLDLSHPREQREDARLARAAHRTVLVAGRRRLGPALMPTSSRTTPCAPAAPRAIPPVPSCDCSRARPCSGRTRD